MSEAVYNIKFVIGSRQLFSVPRKVNTVSWSLANLVDRGNSTPPALTDAAQSYRILSAPLDRFEAIARSHPNHVVGGFQSYRRYYIDMSGSYEDYLGRFSSKTRSTFNRKRRKLAEHSGGALDIREYRTPEEMQLFLDDALKLSAQTYQARLLDAGLPDSAAARAQMLELASKDAVRAYLLFVNGKAVSYLYLPIENGIISYAFLGYDPEISNLSPGTVLQLEALERLFAEQRYRFFDFTEGEGAHKQMFGTDNVEACSFLLLKASLANRALLACLSSFNGSIAALKRLATQTGINSGLRRALRS